MNGSYKKGDRVTGQFGAGTCTSDSYPFGNGWAVSVQFDAFKDRGG